MEHFSEKKLKVVWLSHALSIILSMCAIGAGSPVKANPSGEGATVPVDAACLGALRSVERSRKASQEIPPMAGVAAEDVRGVFPEMHPTLMRAFPNWATTISRQGTRYGYWAWVGSLETSLGKLEIMLARDKEDLQIRAWISFSHEQTENPTENQKQATRARQVLSEVLDSPQAKLGPEEAVNKPGISIIFHSGAKHNEPASQQVKMTGVGDIRNGKTANRILSALILR